MNCCVIFSNTDLRLDHMVLKISHVTSYTLCTTVHCCALTVYCILLPCMCRISCRSCLRNGTSVVYFWTVLFLPFGLARNWTHEMYKRRAYLPRMKQSNLVYLATSQFLVIFTVSLKSVIKSSVRIY